MLIMQTYKMSVSPVTYMILDFRSDE